MQLAVSISKKKKKNTKKTPNKKCRKASSLRSHVFKLRNSLLQYDADNES